MNHCSLHSPPPFPILSPLLYRGLSVCVLRLSICNTSSSPLSNPPFRFLLSLSLLQNFFSSLPLLRNQEFSTTRGCKTEEGGPRKSFPSSSSFFFLPSTPPPFYPCSAFDPCPSAPVSPPPPTSAALLVASASLSLLGERGGEGKWCQSVRPTRDCRQSPPSTSQPLLLRPGGGGGGGGGLPPRPRLPFLSTESLFPSRLTQTFFLFALSPCMWGGRKAAASG